MSRKRLSVLNPSDATFRIMLPGAWRMLYRSLDMNGRSINLDAVLFEVREVLLDAESVRGGLGRIRDDEQRFHGRHLLTERFMS